MTAQPRTHIIVGGGAAGFFGALACAEQAPQDKVILLEKTRQPLAKVRISGGGRCNVTHACFDPAQLVKFYPRGNQELRGPFNRFQPLDTIAWFAQRGVTLKTEADGRMFSITDSSETIIACFMQEAKRLGIEIRLESALQNIIPQSEAKFELTLMQGEVLTCDSLLLATGSAPKSYALLQQMGHHVIPLVPSLFTFNVPRSPFLDLAGQTLEPVQVRLPQWGLVQSGSLLLTHWGFSGPAVLKLSAWAARELHSVDYQTLVEINWLPLLKEEALKQLLQAAKQTEGARQLGSESPVPLPKQLWRRLLALAGIDVEQRWATLANKQIQALIQQLQKTTLALEGKTTYKQEFVTCGGIALEEVNFKTMESRLHPRLFFAGEILNIDGVTGGFNFQNAWTTSWIAAQAMAYG